MYVFNLTEIKLYMHYETMLCMHLYLTGKT